MGVSAAVTQHPRIASPKRNSSANAAVIVHRPTNTPRATSSGLDWPYTRNPREKKLAASAVREVTEELRAQMLAGVGNSTELRDWVGTLVRPFTDHLTALGNPSWHARFAAQAMADPTYRQVVTKHALGSTVLVQAIGGINRCLPDLPKRVRFEQTVMA
jgi:hypothetical protein